MRSSGYNHVVLLGMGGSSLGPEVLGRTLAGVNEGFPRLIVLDSTVPDRVSTVSREIDPAKTLFLVSSKSGGTVETLSFYRYFRNLANESLGRREAGRNFVAITDSGTPLESLAFEEGFRKVYLKSRGCRGPLFGPVLLRTASRRPDWHESHPASGEGGIYGQPPSVPPAFPQTKIRARCSGRPWRVSPRPDGTS